jgi:hypothetical protein
MHRTCRSQARNSKSKKRSRVMAFIFDRRRFRVRLTSCNGHDLGPSRLQIARPRRECPDRSSNYAARFPVGIKRSLVSTDKALNVTQRFGLLPFAALPKIRSDADHTQAGDPDSDRRPDRVFDRLRVGPVPDSATRPATGGPHQPAWRARTTRRLAQRPASVCNWPARCQPRPRQSGAGSG